MRVGPGRTAGGERSAADAGQNLAVVFGVADEVRVGAVAGHHKDKQEEVVKVDSVGPAYLRLVEYSLEARDHIEQAHARHCWYSCRKGLEFDVSAAILLKGQEIGFENDKRLLKKFPRYTPIANRIRRTDVSPAFGNDMLHDSTVHILFSGWL